MTHGLLRVAVVGMLLGVSAAAQEKQGEADKLYEEASALMRDSAWEAAAKAFDKLAESGGRRADAALYWHAYSLNKTARKSEALQALDRLSRQYPESRWMRDARALRLEIRQSRGETVSPEAQQDEELKLLALTGLMNAQPEKALPVLRKLFATGSPKVKERALFVLSQSTAPEAGELLAQVARDTSQPALQKKAIHFLGLCGDCESNARLLDRIYRESTSAGVKREVLHAYMIGRNSSRLIDLAKSESDPAMQAEAIRMLGMVPAEVTRGVLAALYRESRSREVKNAALEALFLQQSVSTLVELARAETDPRQKKSIVEKLTLMQEPEAQEYLLELLQ